MNYRRVIHIDLDAFYASAELLRRPDLRGKPLVVGGSPESRGVVCTSSYEARDFGVRSGMSCRKAKEICPNLIFLSPDMSYYGLLSRKVHKVFLRYTDKIEPYSYDEAYLDISAYSRPGEAKKIARRICKEIHQRTGLTASAGVSYNKFIAKLASDFEKPRGLTQVSPSRAKDFIAQHRVGALHGIGRVRTRFLEQHGFEKAANLQQLSYEELAGLLGSYAEFLYAALQGKDDRPVMAVMQPPKSVGAERTFARDLPLKELSELDDSPNGFAKAQEFFASFVGTESKGITSLREIAESQPAYQDLGLWLYEICTRVSTMLQQQQLAAESLCVKMRSADFQSHSRTISWQGPEFHSEVLYHTAVLAFNQLARKLQGISEGKPVKLRLLGVTGRHLSAITRRVEPALLFRERELWYTTDLPLLR